MMKKMFAMAALMMAAVLFVPGAARAQDEQPVTVAWSVWTGWMPFKLMETQGFMARRAKEYGVNVKLTEFKGYMDSVQAFAAGKVDACAMTSMEALQPASSGVSTIAVLVNDVSNGGDGVLLRKGMTIKDLKGKSVMLEQFSVSHYLLNRALEQNSLSESDVKIVNIPGDDAGKAFLTDDTVQAVATWNPHLFNAQESGKGVVAFDSTKIPGEIIDLLVFNEQIVKKNPKAIEAVVMAWYDAMDMIANPSLREQAITVMAEGAGATPREFEKMMGGTILYTDSGKAIEFFDSAALPETMKRIKQFSFAHELITDEQFEVGFKAGTPHALLTFDSSFMKKAAAAPKSKDMPAKAKPAADAPKAHGH